MVNTVDLKDFFLYFFLENSNRLRILFCGSAVYPGIADIFIHAYIYTYIYALLYRSFKH